MSTRVNGGGPPLPDSQEVVEGAPQPTDRPAPDFEIVGVRIPDFSAAPSLIFQARAGDESGFEVFSIALRTQISIEPAKRRYDDETREKLVELFGAPERWAGTTNSFPWARIDLLVPTFEGETEFELEVPCTYDLEVVAAKYFYSLPDGVAPLAFHFSGSVLYREPGGELQTVLVAWDRLANFELPVETWREMMDRHYPGGGWIRLDHPTLERLHAHKANADRFTMAEVINDLLDTAGAEDG